MTNSGAIDSGLHPLMNGIPPAWASGWGEDNFGVYASFSVGDVVQRLRWIPPGRFMMGSPKSEEGRYDDEGPRHEVTINPGFWMMDTPVRQCLWHAVMGDNPSKFKGPDRPVESIDFSSIEQFLSRLNDRIPELELSLPSEAQWEHACRASSGAATYATATEKLSDIAWFADNSESQTQPVAKKRCNAWGLHDMLGNVWEWCADHWHDNYEGAPTDGSAWQDEGAAATRVMRGGSWYDHARHVRAACRNRDHPPGRYDFVGFRCVRVQNPAERGRR